MVVVTVFNNLYYSVTSFTNLFSSSWLFSLYNVLLICGFAKSFFWLLWAFYINRLSFVVRKLTPHGIANDGQQNKVLCWV